MNRNPLAAPHQSRQRLTGYAWGVAAPLLCTALAWPLRHLLGEASILMTYLLGVFLVASRYGRNASLLASLISAPMFAFYFARPIFSFAISDLENAVGLAVMVVVANLTSKLQNQARKQTELARQREARSDALYRLSRDLAGVENGERVTELAERHILQVFGTVCRLVAAADLDQLPPRLADELDPAAATLAFRDNRTVTTAAARYFPLCGSESRQGVLILKRADSDSREADTFLETFCNLIALNLERLQFAGQAREARLQAEAEGLRNALLSSISHDLRTPLTRIVGAVGALIDHRDRLSVADRDDCQKTILDEARRMSDLTGKLLDMARLNCGEWVLHREWNAIEELVGSALHRLDSGLQGRPVRTRIPDDLPLMRIDAVLMEQVLVNLIENAIKHTPPGTPVDLSAERAEGGIRLCVADYGPGIPGGLENKIFEKFFRGAHETQHTGVGLGLALCRTIVEAHGGRIRAENQPGKGAVFVIDLPQPEQALPTALEELV
ncbi:MULTISPECIES: DUF4118 domain-containing protein [Methylomonas]|uniref:histidine kinase n=1 Tax=Methylomonas koyamae TaxID=702114 RepID=A0A177N4C5_9GAMM|nr:DUF4118 domain-containing protein [Methylomonas koyamae]OAI12867.1 histidine kinase [Methylomonas koyamae]